MRWYIGAMVSGFVLFTLLFWTTKISENETLIRYVNILSVFSTLAVIVSLFLSLKQSEEESDRRLKDEDARKVDEFTAETQRNWIDLEKLFMENYPYTASLYDEIYPGSPVQIPSLSPEQQIEAQDKQVHVASTMIQIIENVITARGVQRGDYGWAPTFISWLGSPTIQRVWASSKKFYNPVTNAFIDGVLNKKVKNTAQTRQLLTATVERQS
jgi:hypothetical protein